MKRKFIKMLCILLMGVSLVQCSGNKNNVNQNNSTNNPSISQPNNNEQNSTNKPVDNKIKISAENVIESKYQSIVPIIIKEGHPDSGFVGTGVMIGPNTLLTNEHVVNEYKKEDLGVALNQHGTITTFDVE